MFENFLRSLMGDNSSPIKTVSASDAKKMVDTKSHMILDVRTTEEYRQGKIVGSKNIPLNLLENRIKELEPFKNKPILVNCLSGGRSRSACSLLVSKGFSDVSNLSGGISAWVNSGYAIH